MHWYFHRYKNRRGGGFLVWDKAKELKKGDERKDKELVARVIVERVKGRDCFV